MADFVAREIEEAPTEVTVRELGAGACVLSLANTKYSQSLSVDLSARERAMLVHLLLPAEERGRRV
jgi:hypothetical protein